MSRLVAFSALALIACGEAKTEPKVPEPPVCEEPSAKPEGREVVFMLAAKRKLDLNCIGGGGWELAEGATYEPTLKNCSEPVYHAATSALDSFKVERQRLRAASVYVYFKSSQPEFYEISYEWYERSQTASLSLLKLSRQGDATHPVEDFRALKQELTEAFHCK